MADAADEFRELFFAVEHALKVSDFKRRGSRRAEVDWVRFAEEELGSPFFDEVRSSGDADMLIGQPPGELLNIKGVPTWRLPTEPITDVRKLLTHGVCQVRNNYFHGDKFVGNSDDWARDNRLLSDAAKVLRRAIATSTSLKALRPV